MFSQAATCTFDPLPEFSTQFDRQPFKFTHHLSEHELFSMPAIRELVKKYATLAPSTEKGSALLRAERPAGFLVLPGRGNVNWGSEDFEKLMLDAFDHLETSGCRIKLTSFNRYDEYAHLLKVWLQDLSEVSGIDIQKEFHDPMVTMFISSPHEATPYHIDLETNFLIQIHGQKIANIFDGNDDSVVSPKNLEEYWDGKIYIPRNPASVPFTYAMGPGEGVHQPSFFPHLIEVKDEISVSVSFMFSRTKYPRAEVNRLNSYIRKAGMNPTKPGKHPLRDSLKSSTMRNALIVKRALRGN